MTQSRRHVAVYGDVDLNLLDGSAVWVQGVAQAFSSAGCDVTVLLKAPVRTDRLIAPLEATPGIRVVRPFEDRLLPELRNALSPYQVDVLLRRFDEERPFDAVVVRGMRLVTQLVRGEAFHGRLWTYLTDVPHSVTEMTSRHVADLQKAAEASRFMLCQTEELRGFLEGCVPGVAGKAVLFPPIIPALGRSSRRESVAGKPLKLVYTGKFALDWKTLEMTRLPQSLAARGLDCELHMVGDKVHREARDTGFYEQMSRSLNQSAGVVWHGGVPRAQAMAIADASDIGVCWRSEFLDSSLELSTKVVEFGEQALPVVLNRNPMHEQLLGSDYPLFVRDELDVLSVIVRAAREPGVYALASERCLQASQAFTEDRAVERIQEYLTRAFPGGDAGVTQGERLKLLVVSHDFKFFDRILDHLRALPEIEVRLDVWPALAEHDAEQSAALRDWADVIVCEWCGPNAIWYSNNKLPGQRLIVRLHRFELYSRYWKQVDIANVDSVVCVSPHYQRLTEQITGWPSDKVTCIPNTVPVDGFLRPKYPGSQFHLGMIGIAPMRKRLDLGVDVLEQLRYEDDRFMLFVKTKMPWEYWWIWQQPEEQSHYLEVLERIAGSPLLRGAVVFDRFGSDVAAWLQKIGWVLSTSDDESFHLAPAEGMASGAVPVVRHWPGAETIYDERWIVGSTSEMADRIRRGLDEDRWESLGRLARGEVVRRYAEGDVHRAWAQHVRQDRDEAALEVGGSAP